MIELGKALAKENMLAVVEGGVIFQNLAGGATARVIILSVNCT
jgi:hypothetical protein